MDEFKTAAITGGLVAATASTSWWILPTESWLQLIFMFGNGVLLLFQIGIAWRKFDARQEAKRIKDKRQTTHVTADAKIILGPLRKEIEVAIPLMIIPQVEKMKVKSKVDGDAVDE